MGLNGIEIAGLVILYLAGLVTTPLLLLLYLLWDGSRPVGKHWL